MVAIVNFALGKSDDVHGFPVLIPPRCGFSGDHRPLICKYVKLWEKKCADDSETSNWLMANTKECAKCNSTIEKNGGCNHMTCKKCRCEYKSWVFD